MGNAMSGLHAAAGAARQIAVDPGALPVGVDDDTDNTETESEGKDGSGKARPGTPGRMRNLQLSAGGSGGKVAMSNVMAAGGSGGKFAPSYKNNTVIGGIKLNDAIRETATKFF